MTRRLVRLLSRPSTLITLAGASFLAADLVLIFVIGPIDFAFDFWCCYQQAGERAITDPSTLYVWSDTYTFRYTPLGALLFVSPHPLERRGAAAWAWIGIKLVVLGVAARWYSRPWMGVDRWLVLLAVVTFPPIVHDLVIGNVSTITLLVLLALARWPDARGGIALGLLLAFMPKPHLIPVLGYLAFRQPRAFLAAIGTIGVSVLAGVALFGIEPWLSVRRDAARAAGADIHGQHRLLRVAGSHRRGRGRSRGRSDLRGRRADRWPPGLWPGHHRGNRRGPVHVHPLPRRNDRGCGARPPHAASAARRLPEPPPRDSPRAAVARRTGRSHSRLACARSGSGSAASRNRLS